MMSGQNPSWRSVADLLPAALAAAAGAAVWAVFRPGLLSFDSIAQYSQAFRGYYTDWHPPLVSAALHLVLALGGSLSRFMLVQSVAGALGVWAFSGAVLSRLFGDTLSRPQAAWLSLLVLLLLLVPVSPLAFYLMTFWKDALAAILLLWIGTLALGRPSAARIAALVLLAAAYGMVRHNAIVTLPVLGLYLAVETWRRLPRGAALALAAAPLAAALSGGALLDAALDVEESHPAGQVMILDLAGLCAEDRSTCGESPLFERHLRVPDLASRYRPGDLGAIFWEPPAAVDGRIVDPKLYPELSEQYWDVAADHPLLLAEVKAESFWTLLGTEETDYFFHDSVAENPFGLQLQPQLASVRERLFDLGRKTAAGGVLRWVAGVHLLWLAANVLWIAALARQGRRKLALLLLVPLAYSLSYLLATTVQDYRFLYPSTLFVQCFTLAAALGGLAAYLRPQKPSGRRP
ncbi:MAG TPA: hypothetical protein VL025_20705 [Thermoanaerobaculia bacterium]|nr:hypothetical protein [Thermoanaerobaculia bacterium]